MQNSKVKSENKYEQNIRSLLPSDMEQHIFRVDNSYRSYLDIIAHNMKHIFPDSFSWDKSLQNYFSSYAYQCQNHEIYRVDDLEEVTFADIQKWMQEEEQFLQNAKMLEEMNARLTRWENGEGNGLSDQDFLSLIFQAFDLLGICDLGRGTQGLFPHLMRPFSDTAGFAGRVFGNRETSGIPAVLINVFCRLLQPGLRFSFPDVGTVMTQRKGHCFYRGENAYYVSSKAGTFRGKKWSEFPSDWAQFIWRLRMNECGLLFDSFDAVRNWHYGDVNYQALAQHYGLRTPMMDITSNLKTALFFACCRWGEDRKWHPLTEQDFREADSRESVAQLGGDSRYGILYRVPTEILDYMWASDQRNQSSAMITPIGYQPFMRCSTQYGYMISTDEKFDLLKEPLFNKYRFRLTSEICQWIFAEMEEGNLIYPADRDIPDISQYVEKINHNCVFSSRNMDIVLECLAKEGYPLDEAQKKRMLRVCEKQGIWLRNNLDVIPRGKWKRMNEKYTLEKACGFVGIEPLDGPVLVMEGRK